MPRQKTRLDAWHKRGGSLRTPLRNRRSPLYPYMGTAGKESIRLTNVAIVIFMIALILYFISVLQSSFFSPITSPLSLTATAYASESFQSSLSVPTAFIVPTATAPVAPLSIVSFTPFIPPSLSPVPSQTDTSVPTIFSANTIVPVPTRFVPTPLIRYLEVTRIVPAPSAPVIPAAPIVVTQPPIFVIQTEVYIVTATPATLTPASTDTPTETPSSTVSPTATLQDTASPTASATAAVSPSPVVETPTETLFPTYTVTDVPTLTETPTPTEVLP
jgi:hypothetical protein